MKICLGSKPITNRTGDTISSIIGWYTAYYIDILWMVWSAYDFVKKLKLVPYCNIHLVCVITILKGKKKPKMSTNDDDLKRLGDLIELAEHLKTYEIAREESKKKDYDRYIAELRSKIVALKKQIHSLDTENAPSRGDASEEEDREMQQLLGKLLKCNNQLQYYTRYLRGHETDLKTFQKILAETEAEIEKIKNREA